MVVDDDPNIRLLLVDILEAAGFVAVGLGSAQAALKLLGTCAPTLVITDLSMPDRDGFWLVNEIRSSGWSFPVVALTAKAVSREMIVAAGFDVLVHKPFSVKEILNLVRLLTGPAFQEPTQS